MISSYVRRARFSLPIASAWWLVLLASCGGAGGGGGASPGGGQAGASGSGASGAGAATGGGGAGQTEGELAVAEFHHHPTRDGAYLQPALTRAAASGMHLDLGWGAAFGGNVYAQPLFEPEGPGGRGAFFVVTESNEAIAIDEVSGSVVWRVGLGKTAQASGAGCGNISPIGATGTPVLDRPSRTLFVAAVQGSDDGAVIKTHLIHALSIDDGSERSGFPADVATVSDGGAAFVPALQNQRSALSIVGDRVYAVYSGHSGDCGAYHGWIVGVPMSGPGGMKGWHTPAQGGGMWAPGGPASDGQSLFVTTGNTFGASSWQGGEAVLRLSPGPVFSGQSPDYYVPGDWMALDAADLDIGGSGPLLFDLPGASPSALLVALGKDGKAYFLDRQALGGVGAAPLEAKVASAEIINSAVTYATGAGRFVALHATQPNSALGCPPGQGGDLLALRVEPGSPPSVTTAWCADSAGQGSPIVTTTDGSAESIVWSFGAEGSQRLRGWNAETGEVVFGGGGAGDGIASLVRHFTTPIAVRGSVYVAGDGQLRAFRPGGP